MDHRLKVLIVVVLTFIITLSGGFLSEYIRQSMTYSWDIEIGDEFVYDVSVIGNTTMGSQILPSPLEPMNGTRIIVEISSLPNLTLMFYSLTFIQEVVEHPKTVIRFSNGSPIPSVFYSSINSHASFSLLPGGAWNNLDSLFPDQVNRLISDHESYISRFDTDSFIFGYWSNETNSRTEWYGILDRNTGVPNVIYFSVWTEGQPWSYFSEVTLTLDN